MFHEKNWKFSVYEGTMYSENKKIIHRGENWAVVNSAEAGSWITR